MLRLDDHPSGRHFLQIPGPTPVPDRILRAMDMPVIDHRGPEFGKLGRRHRIVHLVGVARLGIGPARLGERHGDGLAGTDFAGQDHDAGARGESFAQVVTEVGDVLEDPESGARRSIGSS